ncbi:hypothetical protein HanXRQr2_Chr14g0626531 [Helianthus annuus]|uniref:Uncharacterized protein n=1 Tax=Helianthus annuus TaxID=4232 RepID=A0A9K3H4X2_HELAN|nr:hypothetical protein HanXRQr2_Chr14g0626531 [Helianthus annuus]KAJ0838981.1 hypothetical protein HanPSC8_Chr14g0601301 [Helianthus annuus]
MYAPHAPKMWRSSNTIGRGPVVSESPMPGESMCLQCVAIPSTPNVRQLCNDLHVLILLDGWSCLSFIV